MTADALPDDWSRDRESRRSTDGVPEYTEYVHESGDVRVRVSRAGTTDGNGGGFDITALLYPYTELSEAFDVRTVSAHDRAIERAMAFMKLFDGAYDGPSSVEPAVEYALARSRPADVPERSLLDDKRDG